MAESHVLFALKRRYGQTLGILAADPASNSAADDLAHLAAVIAMFNPDEDLAAIRPIRPYKPNRERWTRDVLRVLKAADRPLRAREIARLVMAVHGIAPDDRGRLLSISCGLQAVLSGLAAQGLVQISGKPRRWAVPTFARSESFDSLTSRNQGSLNDPESKRAAAVSRDGSIPDQLG